VKLVFDQKSFNQKGYKLSNNTTSDLKMYNKLSASKHDLSSNSILTKKYSNMSASAADLKFNEFKTVSVVKKEHKSMFQREKENKLLEMKKLLNYKDKIFVIKQNNLFEHNLQRDNSEAVLKREEIRNFLRN
jgi:hypothetical protein